MPVILDPSDYEQWLDPEAARDDLKSLLVPLGSDKVRAFAVSTHVNKPMNDDARCIDPIDTGA